MSRHQFGLPYKGSKSTIAANIINALPAGENFLDLCCGGGAISHAAFASGKYKTVVGVDSCYHIVKLLRAVSTGGKIDYENYPLVTKGMFDEAVANRDHCSLANAVALVIASFGYNGAEYLWGAQRRPVKYLMQQVISLPSKFERREALRDLLVMLDKLKVPYGTTEFANLSHIEQVQSLNRIRLMEDEIGRLRDAGNTTELRFKQRSIFDFNTDDFDVIYIDPPYRCTQRDYYGRKFDYKRFEDFINGLKAAGKKVFVSEYESPSPEFSVVASWKKNQQIAASGNTSVTENLYA